MKLSVVIVNYNVRHYLWQCLDSVRRASEGLDVEVWVVDNASTDGSVAFLRPFFPEVHFIENTENVGFSRANNQAIRQSTGELVLLQIGRAHVCSTATARLPASRAAAFPRPPPLSTRSLA